LAINGDPAAIGDCDDHAVLMGSLCHSLGIEPKFIITMTDDSKPVYEHVHCAANIASPYEPERWVHLDTSLPHVDYDLPHPGIATAEAKLTDLDRTGLYERQGLGRLAGGGLGQASQGGVIANFLEFGASVANMVMGSRASRRQSRAIDQAAKIWSKAQERVESLALDLQATQHAIDSEAMSYWDARQDAQKAVALSRASEAILLGALALTAAGVVVWSTRPGRRPPKRRRP
ncbi:MAG: transglutaminase domain-containing protein, partial [Deltaproteobacteria bacterium]|nr:transglutaminase domain-containing protein [Deltaproteobacteria bacterium]